MVDKYAVFSGALIKIAGEGHIEGAFVSAADYETLRARNAALEAEVARLRKALECVRVYLMCGAWIFSKSPDEFIKAALEASDGRRMA